MRTIKKGWCIFALLALGMGAMSISLEKVPVFEIVKGLYTVSKLEDSSRYWSFTTFYFSLALFCIFRSLILFYPKKIQDLMSFNEKSRLSFQQILYILLMAIIVFGGSVYVGGIVDAI